ncbi:MAG: hypothetical protein A3I66_03790 [Burkholderiales bacterium RIFCSPLOWO2_02_FULL_57_36]|nr:MAG: hypothetical protein A3I66_03790 [Burkholderiales bacterium RIFCSPLOWO2_02_FULL_57_36]
MKLSRPSRFAAALVALFSILFMQLAVAGYVCPDLATAEGNESASASAYSGHQGMSNCEGMDAKQPGLCHAHAHPGDQSLDKSGLPPVQPFVAAALTLVFRNIQAVHHSTAIQLDPPLLTRTTVPPLSIRNCCFRI